MPKAKHQSIGSIIKQYRNLKGMTQESLAEVLNQSYQQVQKYEYGITIPSLEKLIEISRILEIPMEAFFKENRQHDLMRKIEGEIGKRYEFVEMLNKNPELEEIVKFYSKHISSLREMDLLKLMKDYLNTPQKKRKELLNVFSKVSRLIK